VVDEAVTALAGRHSTPPSRMSHLAGQAGSELEMAASLAHDDLRTFLQTEGGALLSRCHQVGREEGFMFE